LEEVAETLLSCLRSELTLNPSSNIVGRVGGHIAAKKQNYAI
jgi:hypothetical protein